MHICLSIINPNLPLHCSTTSSKRNKPAIMIKKKPKKHLNDGSNFTSNAKPTLFSHRITINPRIDQKSLPHKTTTLTTPLSLPHHQLYTSHELRHTHPPHPTPLRQNIPHTRHPPTLAVLISPVLACVTHPRGA